MDILASFLGEEEEIEMLNSKVATSSGTLRVLLVQKEQSIH
jgi:hypothetical protein